MKTTTNTTPRNSTRDLRLTMRAGSESTFRLNTRRFCAASLLLVLVLVGCSQNNDQPYPNRAIEVIVPFAPGGGSDTFARILKAEVEKQKSLPQPLVIINSPGAGGTIGSRRVKNETPDGYTVLLLHDAILTAKYSGKVLYGPEAFEPVAGTGRTGMVIAVHADAPYNDLNDLLATAAEQPETVTFAANLGAPSHFAGLMLEQAHDKAKFRFAQTGGGADRFTAIKGEHAEATAFSLEEYLRFQPDGVKALAFLGRQRHKELPQLQTAIEQGFFVRHDVTQYWWTPKGTSQKRIDYLRGVLKKAMESETLQAKLRSMKIDPLYIDGESLDEHLAETNDALAGVDAGAKSPLPNVPFALAGLTLLFGVGFGVQRIRDRTTKPRDEPTQQSKFGAWVMVAAAGGLVLAFTLSMFYLNVPLGIATAMFVGILGGLIAWGDFPRKRGFMLAVVATIAILVGVAFYLAFSLLFEIGL